MTAEADKTIKTSNLVSRLRSARDPVAEAYEVPSLFIEAAEEIERLTAERNERERLRAMIAERELTTRHQRDALLWKLRELAAECAECGGTGETRTDVGMPVDVVDGCPECADIRELLNDESSHHETKAPHCINCHCEEAAKGMVDRADFDRFRNAVLSIALDETNVSAKDWETESWEDGYWRVVNIARSAGAGTDPGSPVETACRHVFDFVPFQGIVCLKCGVAATTETTPIGHAAHHWVKQGSGSICDQCGLVSTSPLHVKANCIEEKK